jgi:hypothetical protein
MAEALKMYLLDSVGYITTEMQGALLVTGSHGGESAARYALTAMPLLVIFNDAGCGLNNAGISGLALLESQQVAAATVAHTTARIGHAQSTLNDGILSHVNAPALQLGLAPGQRCSDVVKTLGPLFSSAS